MAAQLVFHFSFSHIYPRILSRCNTCHIYDHIVCVCLQNLSFNLFRANLRHFLQFSSIKSSDFFFKEMVSIQNLKAFTIIFGLDLLKLNPLFASSSYYLSNVVKILNFGLSNFGFSKTLPQTSPASRLSLLWRALEGCVSPNLIFVWCCLVFSYSLYHFRKLDLYSLHQLLVGEQNPIVSQLREFNSWRPFSFWPHICDGFH